MAGDKANNDAYYASHHNDTVDIEEGIIGFELDHSSSSTVFSEIVNSKGR